MTTMKHRDDIPTRDKPLIPTHRRVRHDVWLLAPRTSSRPVSFEDAHKGRIYGSTVSRVPSVAANLWTGRGRSTYGISDILFAPIYEFPCILMIVFHIIIAKRGNEIYETELEWGWRLWLANATLASFLFYLIIFNLIPDKASQASKFWVLSAVFILIFHRLTQNFAIRRGLQSKPYFYFLVLISASLSTIYLGYSEAYRRISESDAPYQICTTLCTDKNLVLPLSEYVVVYDNPSSRIEIISRDEIKSFSRIQPMPAGKQWPDLIASWFR